jgi:hypothetical protein
MTTEKYGALATIKRTLDAIPGVYHEKRWGNPYEGGGKADITGAINCEAIHAVFVTDDDGSQRLDHQIVPFAWRFEIEAKRAGEQARKNQERRMHHWRKIGCLCGVATTKEDVLNILAPALALRGST